MSTKEKLQQPQRNRLWILDDTVYSTTAAVAQNSKINTSYVYY